MANKIGDKLSPWRCLYFIASFSSLCQFPFPSFYWLLIQIPYISNLKEFLAVQNPSIRNHVISFLYNLSRYYLGLSFFFWNLEWPFYQSLADFWFPCSVFCNYPSIHQATCFLLPDVLKLLCQYSYENFTHDRKKHNLPKIWCLISLLFVFQYPTSSSLGHPFWCITNF